MVPYVGMQYVAIDIWCRMLKCSTWLPTYDAIIIVSKNYLFTIVCVVIHIKDFEKAGLVTIY